MDKIKVMISSRCNTKIKSQDGTDVILSTVRGDLKKLIEKEKLFGNSIFDVWINEDAPDVNDLESSWDSCLTRVEESDILVALYTGEAGWSKNDGDIGICHAELATAINKHPGKSFIINVSGALSDSIDTKNAINERFIDYCDKLNRFHHNADTKEKIIEFTQNCITKATTALAKAGIRELRKGQYSLGEALDWTRLDFDKRR